MLRADKDTVVCFYVLLNTLISIFVKHNVFQNFIVNIEEYITR